VSGGVGVGGVGGIGTGETEMYLDKTQPT